MKRRSECADSTTSYVKHKKHVAALEKIYEALTGKKALLAMHEDRMDEKAYDHDYVLGLRARIRGLNTRFNAMRPGANEYQV